MTDRLICKVEPTAPWLIGAVALVVTVALLTAPLWSDTSFYPWDRLDVRWIAGAIVIPLADIFVIRYLIVLAANGGRGVWIEGDRLCIAPRSSVPLRDIARIELVRKRAPVILLHLRNGGTLSLAAWSMDMHEDELRDEIEAEVARLRPV